LAALLSVTDQLWQSPQRYRGATMLDLLHERCVQHVGDVSAAMQLVYRHCHGVMWHQMSTWLLHGLLLDPHQEFFVQRAHLQANGSSNGSGLEVGGTSTSGSNLGADHLAGAGDARDDWFVVVDEGRRKRDPCVVRCTYLFVEVFAGFRYLCMHVY
jgi:hypothetical protein